MEISDLPEPVHHYPVLVQVTEYRVVWVDAENAAQAAECVEYDTSEYLQDVQPYDHDVTITAPKDHWDWDHLYGWRGAAGNNDAHVQTHRRWVFEQELEARQKLHAEAGHPDQDGPIRDGKRYCMPCGKFFVPADQAAEV